ncbi:hypothetical protein F511_09326 [Dorcoceras hygrometricum]|uniref:Uncharacterized protein n=1 Tax=Dorcoceras hygrometricum TaxID=472368 RepID=A0A2Z7C8X9_9LAMI|nr:hypothetical protein F511_09326 [Dorcoceras hygrometricum]
MVQTQNHDSSLNSQFLTPLPNGGYGVNVVDLRSMSYTSLKDLLPDSPTPTTPPAGFRVDRWRDIPIKDPLVQCAAWAYLHPMAETRDGGGGVFSLKGLKKTCCRLLGCFNDVLLVVARRCFGEGSEENGGGGGGEKVG